MDAKASARAKHASSQRGRARHSTRKQQPQQQQQQAGKDAIPSPYKPAPSLPSNWSRYEEDDDLPLDERLADVPAIKSKGANYRDLLAEKSMFRAPDLSSGRKALMEARGRDIWARLRDVDNVWNVSSEEDNFFTLDLDFLGQELETVDIAERLFIDPKYISAEEIEESESAYSRTERGKNEFETSSSRAGRSTHEVAGLKEPAASALSKTERGENEFETSRAGSSTHEVAGLKEPAISALSKESDALQILPAIAHKDGCIKEAVTLSDSKNLPAHSSQQHNKFELSDGKLPQLHSKILRDLKDTLAEIPKTSNDRFEAKSAEAELDALIDLLDNKGTGKASNSLSSMPLGYGKSTGSDAQKSPDNNSRQEDGFVGTSMGSSSKLMVGIADESSLAMKKSAEIAGQVDNIPSRVPTVGSMANVQRSSEDSMKLNNVPLRQSSFTNVSKGPVLDEDFDDWLDSL